MIDIQHNQHPNKHQYQILHMHVRSSQNISMIRISIDWIAMHLIGLQCTIIAAMVISLQALVGEVYGDLFLAILGDFW